MKKIIPLVLYLLAISGNTAHSQHVRHQLNFPVGISVASPGVKPFTGAIWIGPEWRWQKGRYVIVPGYWCHPKRHQKHWIPGHWNWTRRGYIWVGGRWK